MRRHRKAEVEVPSLTKKELLNLVSDLDDMAEYGDYSGVAQLLMDYGAETAKDFDTFFTLLSRAAKKLGLKFVLDSIPELKKLLLPAKEEFTLTKAPKRKHKLDRTDQKFFDLLTNLFTSYVTPENIRYVQYRPYKKYLLLQDADGRLGHINASRSNVDIEQWMEDYGVKGGVPALLAFLEKWEAEPIGRQKRPKYTPPLYD